MLKKSLLLFCACLVLQVSRAEVPILKFGGYPSRDKACLLERGPAGFDVRIVIRDGAERGQCVVFLGRDEFESYMHLLTMLDLLYYERNEQYVRIDDYTTYWYMYDRGRKYLVFTQSGNPELAWLRSDYVSEITAWFVRELKAMEAKRERIREERRQAERAAAMETDSVPDRQAGGAER